MASKDSVIKIIKNQWEEVRSDLVGGKVAYNDLEKLLTYDFFSRFDDFFSKNGYQFDKNLSEEMYLLRAKKGVHVERERFIPTPNPPYPNRMNPPEETFIYFGYGVIGDVNVRDKVYLTCVREIRVGERQDVSILRFGISDNGMKKKVIDLCVSENVGYKVLEWQLLRNSKNAGYTLGKMYIKFISDGLFLEVTRETDKHREYAPFHALAYYFKSKGYAGIIYKSTVFNGGQNLVLFDVTDTCYSSESIEVIRV